MIITYFVHNTTIDNEQGLRSGWGDPPLSELGYQQAAELRALVQDHQYDAIFSSDLHRAHETAQLVFPSATIQRDARLREMNYGRLNGCPESAFPRDPHWCIKNSFQAGESCLDVQARVQHFLDEYEPSYSHIAIVSHRYPQLALEVISHGHSWQEAIRLDWRVQGAWQPGWCYVVM